MGIGSSIFNSYAGQTTSVCTAPINPSLNAILSDPNIPTVSQVSTIQNTAVSPSSNMINASITSGLGPAGSNITNYPQLTSASPYLGTTSSNSLYQSVINSNNGPTQPGSNIINSLLPLPGGSNSGSNNGYGVGGNISQIVSNSYGSNTNPLLQAPASNQSILNSMVTAGGGAPLSSITDPTTAISNWLNQNAPNGNVTNSGNTGSVPDLNLTPAQLCATLQSSIRSNEFVYFYTMPEITETGTVDWKSMQMVQAPGEILSYGGTKSRTFNITVKFVSRTSVDAGINGFFVQLLRSWKEPYFGASNTKLLGAPPPILYFTAFTNPNNTMSINYNKIPVVLEHLSITYSGDSDFIRSVNPATKAVGDPWPVIMNVTIGLKEAHAPTNFLNFDLSKYKMGQLPGF